MVNHKKSKKTSNLPFVSVCTPTFNRRPFIPAMIKCFNHQDYPKDRVEWIIIDDGTDKIEDMVNHVPQVKYFKYDEKMTLGKKRNLMHEKSKGEIIVYMDDDDYYPPNRISHAVERLMSSPDALCAGSSKMYIWFKHINQMWQFGPYGPNHSTAGTFAFKRKLLSITKYNEKASLAEEKEFLKDYTIPFVQLDEDKVILVFSHEHNTFDKRKLLEQPDHRFAKPVSLKVEDFIHDKELYKFYTSDIEELLKNYQPGRPEMKPDVLNQIVQIEERRKKEIEAYNNQMRKNQQTSNQNNVILQEEGKPPRVLTADEIIKLLTQQQQEIALLNKTINSNKTFIELLKNKIIEKDKVIKGLTYINDNQNNNDDDNDETSELLKQINS